LNNPKYIWFLAYSIQNYETITLNPKFEGGGCCDGDIKVQGRELVATIRRCDVVNGKMERRRK